MPLEREYKKRGGNLVAWETVQKSKDKGGLGVINLRLQNDALLLKHLHKFYNQEDTPWVNLIRFKYYQHRVPHATREVGSFGGRISCASILFSALSLIALLETEALCASGRTIGRLRCCQSSSQD